VLEVDFFDRTPESLGHGRERKPLPIEEKETYRWLEGYRLACQLQGRQPETQIVSVADSEADVYEIFLETDKQTTPADFIIRAKQDRTSPQRDRAAGPCAYQKVRQEVAASELVTVREIELCPTPKRAARRARLEVRAQRVTVKPPADRKHLDTVSYNLVLVEETGRPADDETRVSWLLITTLPITSTAEVLRVIDYYVGRWPIEVFFRIFKSGCRVEEIQLETNARLRRCLMFYKIIAWRIAYLTYLGRASPNLACDQVFAECEWKAVWRVVTRQRVPKKAPPLGKFLLLLAELGGYNHRTGDAPPGPQTLWLALRRMLDFALAWKLFQSNDEKGG